MKLESNPASAGIGDGEVYPVLPPLFLMESDSRCESQPCPVSIPTLTPLFAELKDVPIQRVAPHSFSFPCLMLAR